MTKVNAEVVPSDVNKEVALIVNFFRREGRPLETNQIQYVTNALHIVYMQGQIDVLKQGRE